MSFSAQTLGASDGLLGSEVRARPVAPTPKAAAAETFDLDALGDEGELDFPDTSGMTEAEKIAALRRLLEKVQINDVKFNPSISRMPDPNSKSILRLARVLKVFPAVRLKCTGHAKGKPGENSVLKRQISETRAESLSEALRAHGVTNDIVVVGYGSALGMGGCVRVHTLSQEEAQDGLLMVSGVESLPKDQQEQALNQLLQEALDTSFNFAPNKHNITVDGMEVVRKLAPILRSFPDFVVRCESHTKGKAEENNENKRKMSQLRAEGIRAALREHGVRTPCIYCIGCGSARGLGQYVRMATVDLGLPLEIPECLRSSEEQDMLLNRLLEAALEANVEFEPNKSELPPSCRVILRSVACVLRSFSGASLRCEGHTKGTPVENNSAKRKLSLARAEAFCAALLAEGVATAVACIGEGSLLGRGMHLRMVVDVPVPPPTLEEAPSQTIYTIGMSAEEIRGALNKSLDVALATEIDFAPNEHAPSATGAKTISLVAQALKGCPDRPAIKIEGHTKGQPSDDSDAKRKLSYARARSVKAALKAERVTNYIHCIGMGSAEGLGMRVKVYAVNSADMKVDVKLPDCSGMSRADREKALNELLAEVFVKKSMTFEPNKAEVLQADVEIVRRLGAILTHLPDISVVVESHTKGLPADNNAAKTSLSEARAQAVRAALCDDEGVANDITCIGRGCSEGLGMCVRIFVAK